MLIRIAVYLTGLMMLSLSAGAHEANPKTAWGTPVEGCRISLNVDKIEYDFGESINIVATIQNVGREKLRVEGNQRRFPYRIELYGPNAEETPFTLWGRVLMRPRSGSVAMGFLSRGEGRADTFSMLNRAYDMSLAGKYVLVVHQTVPSEMDPNAWIDVASNEIIIEIKSSQP